MASLTVGWGGKWWSLSLDKLGDAPHLQTSRGSGHAGLLALGGVAIFGSMLTGGVGMFDYGLVGGVGLLDSTLCRGVAMRDPRLCWGVSTLDSIMVGEWASLTPRLAG